MADGTPQPQSVKQLRQERDRFLAFAFCRADLLLELTADHKIVFASGACRSVFGLSADEMKGHGLQEFIVEQDQSVVNATLGGMTGGARPEPINIMCRNTKGAPRTLSLTGYFVEDLQRHYFLSCKIPAAPRASSGAEAREAAGAVMHDTASFNKVVSRSLETANDHTLTLLELSNYSTVLDQLDTASQEELHETINSYLRASSDDANSAAAFGEGRFGLIHRPEVDIEQLSSKISAKVKSADPSGLGVEIEKASVILAEAGVGDGNPAQAFDYMVRQFARGGDNGIRLNDLQNGLPKILAQIQRTATEVRSVIADESFRLVFQPIVRLDTRATHHYELLARIDGEIGSPARFIQSAEDLSLIRGFDMAVCRKAISWLRKQGEMTSQRAVAVNLSAQSIGDSVFVETLREQLVALGENRKHILFEITESSRMENPIVANNAIQALRNDGHLVCLDDFGVGEASLQYLRQFQVDILKIDGSYVRECLHDKTSAHILKAIADLCVDLGIDTVAEMVEDDETCKFLTKSGIVFAQGYHFGRPSQEIEVFEQPERRPAVARRLGAQESWG
ncbi:sensor domain-containing phosphodiesterase [Denitrobaculum tricleocarpae]|uniref:EAL domain-containing protein n=1 Tax=Denitrobaculum tricleocarpae TaxID=2591009 RepID=A0A545U291_9PROT|nr:EAL domain-containing protein [Denitrobaculum tricleocarpae]TQV83578.1 EAL domain-containing protein [Denitrobaculum tricleocarpae]